MRYHSIVYAGLLLATLSTDVHAQKKTTFYPNGKREFEGEYKIGYIVAEPRDQMNFDTSGMPGKRRAGQAAMMSRGAERDVAPQRIYNGECTFYYDNGEVSFKGTYANGIKEGLFSYFYFNGKREADNRYTHGMADGKWTGWYAGGGLRTEQSYKAFSDQDMDSILIRRNSGGNPFMANPMIAQRSRFRTFVNDSLQKSPMNSFSKFMDLENNWFKNTNWDGDFTTYYENGKKCTEMHYANNVRTGHWYYRAENGDVLVEMTFTDGKIASIVNNQPATAQPAMPTMPGGMTPAMRDSLMARRNQPPMPGGMGRPTPPVDLDKYVQEHVQYPKSEKKDKKEGEVVVKFMVNEDGSTSDFQVVKGLGAAYDQEAIKVLKEMPKWKPAMRGTTPSKASYTATVPFKPGKK